MRSSLVSQRAARSCSVAGRSACRSRFETNLSASQKEEMQNQAAYEDLNSWREIEEDEFGNLLVADASHDLQRERRRLLLETL